MEPLEGDSYREMVLKYIRQLKEWLQPDPADSTALTIVKMIYKGIAVLVLVALSPVILLLLAIIFFATL